MKAEQEVKEKLLELEKRGYNRFSFNMQYEWFGAKEALEWVLGLKEHLLAGRR